MKTVCLVCGKEINNCAAHVKRGCGKFCSYKCAGIYRRKAVNIKCEICGKLLKATPLEIKNGKKFCSRACQKIGFTGRKINRGGRVERCCEICGVKFTLPKAWVKKGGGRFCSNICHGKWISKFNIGKQNPAWKGGIKKEKTVIRDSQAYKVWRKAVLKRDKYTCQKCGATGCKMHAHHKKRFAVILADLQQNFPLLKLRDMAEQHPHLWDVANGETLCGPCHYTIHKGKRI